MKAKSENNPAPQAARMEASAPVAVDECLVVFICNHTHAGQAYCNGDALKVSAAVRDELRHFEVIL